jgi:hypothetical protein
MDARPIYLALVAWSEELFPMVDSAENPAVLERET